MLSFGALSLGVSALPLSAALALDDHALPSGGVVTGGSASFDYSSPGQLHVHQGSDRAVIDWDSFNIGRDALTEFHQPSASSLVVNRVTGNGDPTQILGTMRANGNVMVLDRNGVIFGQDSRVDVGGIIVSTGDVNTASVMSGDTTLQISGADTGGEIINRGSITVADAGLAGFVAPTIRNSGVIQARMGKVILASGAAATLDMYGDGLIEVAVDQKLQSALIENTGTIAAEGGTVLMTASAAKDVVNTVINTSGIVNVSSVTQKGGKIILEGANTKVSGILDASGYADGGEILVGGDYQGGGTVKTANNTIITETASLRANTTGTDGDGGKVIVWADDSTQFSGAIEAKGGSHSGNGGFVETSGKINLGVTGSVNASAPNGAAGEWLLDPQNVRITNSGAGVPLGGGTYDPTGVADPFIILDSSISAALSQGNNVTITTFNAGQAQAGNITVTNANILKSGGGDATLTLKADSEITINGASSIKSDTGKLNVILWADSDNVGGGRVVISSNSAIETNDGEFFAGAGLDDGSDINDVFGNVLYNGAAGDGRPDYLISSPTVGAVTLFNSSLKTGAGNVTMLGRGGTNAVDYVTGVALNGGTIETSSGNVLLIGRGGNSPANVSHWGVTMESAGSITSTAGGNITIDGQGGTGNGTSYGLYMKDGTTILAKDGAITITAKGGTGGINNHGLNLSNGNISSNGNSVITLKGERGEATGATGGLVIGGSGSLGSATTQGNINLITDRINIGGAVQSLAEILIKAIDPSTTIGVAGGAGDLNLTDSEVNYLNAGTKLVIGDSINGIGDVIIDSWNLSTKTYDVEIYGNDITIRDTDAAPTVDYALELGTGNFMAHARDSDNTANPGDRGDLATQASSIIRKKNNIAGTSTIDLRADGMVTVGGQILAETGGSAPKLNILINSNRDSGAVGDGGSIVVSATGSLQSNGGIIALTGGSIDDGSNGGTVGDGIADGMAVGVSNYGVYVQGGINAGPDGNIQIAGQGFNQAGVQGHGVLISSATVKTTNGKISIRGQGGNGTTDIDGILLNAATIEATEGSIDIRGTGGGGTDRNNGVVIVNGMVESKGIGTNAATIYIEGQQGGTGHGGGLNINGATIKSIEGDITLKGTGGVGTTSSAAEGVRISGSGIVQSTGLTADAAKIFINAQGGGTGAQAAHYGFVLYQGALESRVGAIDITAVGGNGTSNNHGMYMQGGVSPTRIETLGAAEITIRATGGNGTQYSAIRMTDGAFIGEGSQIGAASGKITLITDGFEATPTTGTISTLGDIFVTPKTTTTNIGIGYDLAHSLSLNDAEIGMFSAGGELVIGDALGGTGDITMTTWDLSSKTHHVQLYGNDITIGGITTGAGNVYMYAKDGTITASADSNSNAAGNLYLLGGRDVAINEDLVNTGTGSINIFAGWDSASGITTNALFDLNNINLTATARDITLGANGRVSSAGVGTAVLLVASDDIINNASSGASAITASAGRYLAYATHPTETIKGGLTAKNLYGRTYATHKSAAIGGTDSHFIFGYAPTLTLTANSITVSDLATAPYGYGHSALFAGDLIGDALSGTAIYTPGVQSANARPITLSGLSSPMGYILNFVNGTMTLTGAALADSAPDVTPVINHYANVDKTETGTSAAQSQVEKNDPSEEGSSKSMGCLLEDSSSGGCLIN